MTRASRLWLASASANDIPPRPYAVRPDALLLFHCQPNPDCESHYPYSSLLNPRAAIFAAPRRSVYSIVDGLAMAVAVRFLLFPGLDPVSSTLSSLLARHAGRSGHRAISRLEASCSHWCRFWKSQRRQLASYTVPSVFVDVLQDSPHSLPSRPPSRSRDCHVRSLCALSVYPLSKWRWERGKCEEIGFP